MRTKLLAFKQELKQLASDIRTKKSQRCAANSGYVHNLHWDRVEYRFKHIAYCLARGRTMEQIEAKVHPGNEISEYAMKKIITMRDDLIQGEVV